MLMTRREFCQQCSKTLPCEDWKDTEPSGTDALSLSLSLCLIFKQYKRRGRDKRPTFTPSWSVSNNLSTPPHPSLSTPTSSRSKTVSRGRIHYNIWFSSHTNRPSANACAHLPSLWGAEQIDQDGFRHMTDHRHLAGLTPSWWPAYERLRGGACQREGCCRLRGCWAVRQCKVCKCIPPYQQACLECWLGVNRKG